MGVRPVPGMLPMRLCILQEANLTKTDPLVCYIQQGGSYCFFPLQDCTEVIFQVMLQDLVTIVRLVGMT